MTSLNSNEHCKDRELLFLSNTETESKPVDYTTPDQIPVFQLTLVFRNRLAHYWSIFQLLLPNPKWMASIWAEIAEYIVYKPVPGNHNGRKSETFSPLALGFMSAIVFSLLVSLDMDRNQLIESGGILIVCALMVEATWRLVSFARRLKRAESQNTERIADFHQQLTETIHWQQLQSGKYPLSWPGYRKFIVAKKVRESGDVYSFYLTPLDNESLPPFKPGQYLPCRIGDKGRDKQVERCYSLSDAPNPDYFRITNKKVHSGLGTGWLHDEVNEGDILETRAPQGHFCIDVNDPRPLVLIGGGVGLTPLLSMLNSLIDAGSKKEIWCFYGVRNSTEHIQKDHLQRIAQTCSNTHLHVCYSQPTDYDVPGLDFHHNQRISIDLLKSHLPSNNYEFYLCGPNNMMRSLEKGLEEWGVPKADISFEGFGPAPVHRPDKDQNKITREIYFKRSQKRCSWDNESRSILELAESNAIALNFGCRNGNCGNCAVKINGGEVSYLNEPGVDIDKDTCLPCIAIPKGDVVLDA